jgi:uncharacterized membrane protein YcaP (DUF421 family)
MKEVGVFDFHRIFLGDLPLLFLAEIVFRTVLMYAYTILWLRFLGKRSIGQLSTLELAIIICFGSAAGDPMMGVDIPILHGLVVITTVALLQTGMEWVINRHKKLEVFMEGQADCLVDNGMIRYELLRSNSLSHADLFRALRNREVEHLGQLNKAFFETSWLISVHFQPPKKIQPGLNIMPDGFISKRDFAKEGNTVRVSGFYSCVNCGFTRCMPAGQIAACPVCKCGEWIKSAGQKSQS